MAAATTHFRDYASPVRVSGASAKAGFFARLMRSLQDARMKQAEREVERLIEARGGRLTDDVERRITQHFV